MSDTAKPTRQLVIGIGTDAGKRFVAVRDKLQQQHGFKFTATQVMEHILSVYDKATQQPT